jgi:hypothetical protein
MDSDSLSRRIRALFWVAATNFVLPGMIVFSRND